jgi:hypothetical protein
MSIDYKHIHRGCELQKACQRGNRIGSSIDVFAGIFADRMETGLKLVANPVIRERVSTMSRLSLIILFFVCACAQAQYAVWSPDSISKENPNHRMDVYHELLRYHDPFMYLTFPIIKPVKERALELVEGEGKNGYFLEGNFAYRFIAVKGKYYSPALVQRMRLTFDVGLTPRLTQDKSAPLLPVNNRFGPGLDFLVTSLKGLEKNNFVSAWLTAQLHHYSNGESDSFFIDDPVKRNNYTGGDFSTNYFRIMLNIGRNSEQGSMIKVGVGYQQEVSGSGVFAQSSELYHFYGNKRWLGDFQFTKRPRLVVRNIRNRNLPDGETVSIQRQRQVSFRTELEFIQGDLSNFEGDNKYRLGWHNYLTYMPSITNEIGFIIHTFLGRDYLNIRFDDVVFLAAAGFYVKFNSK